MTVMPMPTVDLDEMVAARLRLAQVALLAGRAESALDASTVSVSSWAGPAADAYYDARGRLSRRVGSVMSAAGAAAAAIATFGQRSDQALAGMTAAGRDLDQALDERARLAGTVPVEPAWVAELIEGAWRRYETCSRDYDEAVQVVAAQLEAAGTLIEDVPLGTGDQVTAGTSRFWTDAVVDPARGTWGLTAGFFIDRQQWQTDVTALPGQYWQMLKDPLETAGVMVGEEQWRAGEWGAGLGAVVANFVGTKGIKTAVDPETPAASMRNRADPNAPRPKLQSLDELFERVDLSRHEHHDYGHAIRRHVDVNDTYLQERLVLGTLKDNDTRQLPPPPIVSAFTDLDTAELALTEVLRLNEEAVQVWAAGTDSRLPLTQTLDRPLGRVMSQGEDGFVIRDASTVKLWLARKDGQIFISTAFVE